MADVENIAIDVIFIKLTIVFQADVKNKSEFEMISR